MKWMNSPHIRRVLSAVPLAMVLCFSLVMADGGANHRTQQTLPIELGTSGGNVNDRSRAFCCSGTLGALVERGGQSYILSNNHVLGRSGAAIVGDNISQPGLIDVGCNVNGTTTVADFSEAPALGSANVDAALALTVPGAVNPTGEIIDVGIPSSTPAVPALSMPVAKSGRTTGLTCGTISSINTDVSIRYQAGCGKGKRFLVAYTDQVVITGGTFSAGGDSGSLIVTQSGKNPVALLYAGSSTTTIGNPIQDVISALGGISFVGGGGGAVSCGGASAGSAATGPQLKKGANLDKARGAKEQYAKNLMQDDAVLGVGVGVDDDGEPVVVIYVEQGREHKHIPEMMNGVRARIVRTDAFQAYGWNEKLMPAGACKAR